MTDAPEPTKRPRRRRHIGLWVLGTFVVAVTAAVALWDWDWFLPFVEARASATLGRKVTAQHLHVHLGRIVTVSLDNVEVAGVDGRRWRQAVRRCRQADRRAGCHGLHP